MKKHPLSVGAGIRQQASQLPQMYAQRQNKEYQDSQINLGEQKLALEQKAQSMQASQFKKSMKMEREAQDTAKGGMMLKGGLAVGKAAYSEGMFSPGMDKITGMFQGGTKAGYVDRTSLDRSGSADNPSQVGGASQRGSGGSSWDSFSGGGWKGGVWGGLSGGMMGAGAAKALGAKKKWQVAAAGAAGGMASTWMTGAGGNPFSMALGGALGGGLGMLIG